MRDINKVCEITANVYVKGNSNLSQEFFELEAKEIIKDAIKEAFRKSKIMWIENDIELTIKEDI